MKTYTYKIYCTKNYTFSDTLGIYFKKNKSYTLERCYIPYSKPDEEQYIITCDNNYKNKISVHSETFKEYFMTEKQFRKEKLKQLYEKYRTESW